MRANNCRNLLAIAILAVGPLSGCGGDPTNHVHEGSHAHEHPNEGPHHGSLIELGGEQYHAELVHDDQLRTVTIYILDREAKAPAPIAAPQVVVNLKHAGRPRQFVLAAAPEATDPEGHASRFVSDDQALGDALDAEGASARLMVATGGKSYSGDVSHIGGEHNHWH